MSFPAQPTALIIGASRAQLRSFGHALEQAGYRVTVIGRTSDITKLASANNASLLVYGQAMGETSALDGYRKLAQRPALVFLDGENALPISGFQQASPGSCNAKQLELFLREQLASLILASDTPAKPVSSLNPSMISQDEIV